MRKIWIAAAGAALALSGAAPARAQQIALTPFVTGLSSIVHVQHDEERDFYELERLWKDCPEIELGVPRRRDQ